MHGIAGLDENNVEPSDDCRVQFGHLRRCFEKKKKRTTLLVTDSKSLYVTIHRERATPSSTDKRLAIELDIVRSWAVGSDADLKWIDAWYLIADWPTKHASRKSLEVWRQLDH